MEQDAPFTVPEVDLARSIGVERPILRHLRDEFHRGVDWGVKNGKICWSEEGARAVVARLSPQNGSEPHPDPENAVVAPPQVAAAPLVADSEALKVVFANFPNTRVVQCVRENAQNGENHERITVRVRDARLFRPGMRLMARPGLGSAWEFMGNPEKPGNGARYPRRPGRW